MDEKKINRAFELLEQGIEHWDEVTRLIREAKAPQPRFYVGQPVLVKDRQGDWGSTEINIERFEYYAAHNFDCKPDPDAVSLPNWIEHDKSSGGASCPDSSVIVWVNEKGISYITKAPLLLGGVVCYCIIPLPEWINP